jgi:integral membrane protein
MMKKNPFPSFRSIALAEGVSFLVLLGIAMPLKYFAGMPAAVKWTGWAHGILFVAFCFALLRVMLVAKWPMARGVLFFMGALLPFGPFILDRRLREYEAEFVRRGPSLDSATPRS